MNPIHISMHYPRWFILLTAFATGAVVMALEILGQSALAPVFGNSLFVWGALIGVILAAMSSGYAFGGWIWIVVLAGKYWRDSFFFRAPGRFSSHGSVNRSCSRLPAPSKILGGDPAWRQPFCWRRQRSD